LVGRKKLSKNKYITFLRALKGFKSLAFKGALNSAEPEKFYIKSPSFCNEHTKRYTDKTSSFSSILPEI